MIDESHLSRRMARRKALVAWTADGSQPDFEALARILVNLGHYSSREGVANVVEDLAGTWRTMILQRNKQRWQKAIQRNGARSTPEARPVVRFDPAFLTVRPLGANLPRHFEVRVEKNEVTEWLLASAKAATHELRGRGYRCWFWTDVATSERVFTCCFMP